MQSVPRIPLLPWLSLHYAVPPCSAADPAKCSVRILDAVKALAALLW